MFFCNPKFWVKRKHEIWQCFQNPFKTKNGSRWRRALVGAMASMESLCLTSGRIFTPEVSKEFQRSYIVFRSSLNQLALKALDDKLLRYHVRPKLHQLGHLAFHFVPKNPRYMSCYQDEDYISRTKALAERCHPVFVSQQACFRYSVRMCLTWSNMCE